MKNMHLLVAVAAFSLSAFALAVTSCPYPDDPNWDPQEGTCQGNFFPSCQDTNLIDDGGCEGSGSTTACTETAHKKVKRIYQPQYAGSSCSSTNPCVDVTPSANQTLINYKTGASANRACIATEVPVDEPVGPANP